MNAKTIILDGVQGARDEIKQFNLYELGIPHRDREHIVRHTFRAIVENNNCVINSRKWLKYSFIFFFFVRSNKFFVRFFPQNSFQSSLDFQRLFIRLSD